MYHGRLKLIIRIIVFWQENTDEEHDDEQDEAAGISKEPTAGTADSEEPEKGDIKNMIW